jgi:hypothetical protein
MLKTQVVIGGTYTAKVSGKVQPVRITGKSPFGGWDAVNTETGRTILVRSARRLRQTVELPQGFARPGRRATVAKTTADAPVTGMAHPREHMDAGPGEQTKEFVERMRAAGWPEDRIRLMIQGREATAQIAEADAEQLSAPAAPVNPVPQAVPNGTQTEITCYLCGTPVRKEDQQYIGNGKSRHKDCDPCAQERAEVHRQEDEVMAAAKKSRKVSQKAAARATAAPGRTGAPKGAKAAPGRDVGHEGASHGEGAKKVKKPGLVDAAIQVMREAGKPMNCQEVVKVILEKKLWETTGKTPAATLYSSILREIQKKGSESRFKKVERGQFALTT